MTKKNAVAKDATNIRRVRKGIKAPAASLYVVPAQPEDTRERWIARNPNLVPVA